jgi:hypothetical protein
MINDNRFTLSQSDIEAIKNRRALDTEFAAFMQASIVDRRQIREEVEQLAKALAANTHTTQEVHTALFAKDDNNDFGTAGLVVNMQSVLNHVKVVCGIARFFRWVIVGVGGMAAAAVPFGKIFGWW